MPIGNLEIIGRLCLAALLGGIIGLERESAGRPAGFRTHILVATGASLLMLVSMYAFTDVAAGRYDPGRIAAQVVSGIGFLGAGTIWREGVNVQGLTTAASLWMIAGIGLAVGAGFYFPAIFATSLAALTLVTLSKLEWHHLINKNKILTIVMVDEPGQLAIVFDVLAKHKVNVLQIDLSSSEQSLEAKLNLKVILPNRVYETDIVSALSSYPEIKGVNFS